MPHDGSTPRRDFFPIAREIVSPEPQVLRGKHEIDLDACLNRAFGVPPQADPDQPYPAVLDEAIEAVNALVDAYCEADHAARRAYHALTGTAYGQPAAAMHRALSNLKLPGDLLNRRTWAAVQASKASSLAASAYLARQSGIETKGD